MYYEGGEAQLWTLLLIMSNFATIFRGNNKVDRTKSI